MPPNQRKQRTFNAMRRLTTILTFALLVACSDESFTVPTSVVVEPPEDDFSRAWTVRYREPLEYPLRAVLDRKNGCVILGYGVNSSGKPVDIKTLAQWPVFAAYGFESSAKNSLSKWQFEPTEANSSRAEMSTFQYFTFQLEGELPYGKGLTDMCAQQLAKAILEAIK